MNKYGSEPLGQRLVARQSSVRGVTSSLLLVWAKAAACDAEDLCHRQGHRGDVRAGACQPAGP